MVYRVKAREQNKTQINYPKGDLDPNPIRDIHSEYVPKDS
jgi:hypothetical protein